MKTTLPADCGNAPRMVVVGDFVTNWAKGNSDAVAAGLVDDVDWSVLGRAFPQSPVSSLKVTTIITHGRFASCDGFLEADSDRIAFSHVLRFASTSKSAKITEVRTYLIDERT